MKILFIADEESKIYWDFFKKEQFEGIDLIISCGDLKPEYLSFLATMTTVPVLSEAIMTINMKSIRRKDAYVLRIVFTISMEYVFLDLAVPTGISRESINIPNFR